ncbi:MAG: GFA family protein [Alphaproteobacteria bacterium]
MTAGASYTGRCLCGEVRFRATGEPKWSAYCHCKSCRRATGAPVAAYAGFPSDKVQWIGANPAYYESSPGVRRGFCPRCGSSVYYEGERWPGETHLHLGLFDEPQRIVPIKEAFKAEKLPWLKLEV